MATPTSSRESIPSGRLTARRPSLHGTGSGTMSDVKDMFRYGKPFLHRELLIA